MPGSAAATAQTKCSPSRPRSSPSFCLKSGPGFIRARKAPSSKVLHCRLYTETIVTPSWMRYEHRLTSVRARFKGSHRGGSRGCQRLSRTSFIMTRLSPKHTATLLKATSPRLLCGLLWSCEYVLGEESQRFRNFQNWLVDTRGIFSFPVVSPLQ